MSDTDQSSRASPGAGLFRRLGAAIFMTTVGKWLGVSIIGAVSTVVGLAYTAVHDDELVLVTSFGRIVQGPLEPGIQLSDSEDLQHRQGIRGRLRAVKH